LDQGDERRSLRSRLIDENSPGRSLFGYVQALLHAILISGVRRVKRLNCAADACRILKLYQPRPLLRRPICTSVLLVPQAALPAFSDHYRHGRDNCTGTALWHKRPHRRHLPLRQSADQTNQLTSTDPKAAGLLEIMKSLETIIRFPLRTSLNL
jgi:hypothetical protein